MRRMVVGIAPSSILASSLLLALSGCAAGMGDSSTYEEGEIFDELNPGFVEDDSIAKADANRYEVPTDLPELVDPRIVISLEGLTVELIDDATGFHKVYPAGVGTRGRSGRSITPTGDFATGSNPDDSWWYYKRRYVPEYFDGLPFLRITARNSSGANTYGLHGPITRELQRSFVSHGCIRMRARDIVELFYLVLDHPGTPVKIQTDKRYRADGTLVDVTPPDQDPVLAWQMRPRTWESTTAVAIPDASETGVSTTIEVPAESGAIGTLAVEVDVQHPSPTDLVLTLEHDGRSVVLHDGAEAYAGYGIRRVYRIEGWQGLRAAGVWKLSLRDRVSGTTGSLSGWKVTITKLL